MDREKIMYHIRGLLEAVGEDPDREGLQETPDRVARMLEEVLEGPAYSNHDIAVMFGLIIGRSSPHSSAIDRNVLFISSLVGRPNDIFDTPSTVCIPSLCFTSRTAFSVSESRNSSRYQ